MKIFVLVFSISIQAKSEAGRQMKWKFTWLTWYTFRNLSKWNRLWPWCSAMVIRVCPIRKWELLYWDLQNNSVTACPNNRNPFSALVVIFHVQAEFYFFCCKAVVYNNWGLPFANGTHLNRVCRAHCAMS